MCLALLYWELILAEGAHLGPRVVIQLYDWVASRYDTHIKKFDLETEADILGLPLAVELAETESPRVLDVCAGTGRVSRALLRQIAFDGVVVNVDLAARMLRVGRETTAPWPGSVAWLRAPAGQLPFTNNLFDCVTCLEALEFVPDARAVLAECLRVLKPGGLLVITNRVGWEARLIVGKNLSRSAFRQLLADLPLEVLRVEPWVVDYDWAWARKISDGRS
ncbi:MAG: class I SAM-dependent methyltransferase [Anaerolineales bacterium]